MRQGKTLHFQIKHVKDRRTPGSHYRPGVLAAYFARPGAAIPPAGATESQRVFLTAPRHPNLEPVPLILLLADFSTSTNFTSHKRNADQRNADLGSCFITSSLFSSPILIAFLPTHGKLLRGPFFVQLGCACSSLLHYTRSSSRPQSVGLHHCTPQHCQLHITS